MPEAESLHFPVVVWLCAVMVTLEVSGVQEAIGLFLERFISKRDVQHYNVKKWSPYKI